ncbi:excinuclease ABC subunit UvrA [Limosilactobacillus allomucosae]|uniref:excinuclease ABC subunit UvrA n=1 Tax=Limosilactobacillus allomucosae TaxID=3142938 RepID=UPI0032632902
MVKQMPMQIEVRGAHVHNLKNLDVDIPLHEIVGIAGVSGSGKSSLALGVLYAEGSRRYLEALSTYTRRRMSQADKAAVDEVRYVPAALALRQRPGVPGIRSTFGTATELLNSLRLMFSRLACHRCPNGHYLPPTMKVAAQQPLFCPECGAAVAAPGAEDLAFNSDGACPKCGGTGWIQTVDVAKLVPDETKTIEQGAVLPWSSLMWKLMVDVAREMGVRTNVPFNQLTKHERDIVFHGPAEKRRIFVHDKKNTNGGYLNFTYFNAIRTVENALAKVKNEKGMQRVARFLKMQVCPDCGGTRLSKRARAPRIKNINLAQACQMTLTDSIAWVKSIPDWVPDEMKKMAENIVVSYLDVAERLLDLGLGYLTLDRAAATLSNGERQRMQLARAVRNRTTGILYVLDEPSIGLHPANLEGLNGVMDALVADGNSVVLVDHDTQVLKHADWLLELGPVAGAGGGRIIAQGTVADLIANSQSQIGPFLKTTVWPRRRPLLSRSRLFEKGKIQLQTNQLHTVKPLAIKIPEGRLTAVTGVSGSGKSTVILESLLPGLQALFAQEPLPDQVASLTTDHIQQARLIDATPIGINVRSTVATYVGLHDELRKLFAQQPAAKDHHYQAGDFSYNTGKLRCPTCNGTGTIALDVQFLPDVTIVCPECGGTRYRASVQQIKYVNKQNQGYSLPELMALSVDEALPILQDIRKIAMRLQTLHDLGLGYLTLGEATPGLSGGEAQRLKLASEMRRGQKTSLFIFDEPTIGLHPLDVQTLIGVFQKLINQGATIIVIEHDREVISNADWVIDLGPGGGKEGGRVVAQGTVAEIKNNPASVTGRYL